MGQIWSHPIFSDVKKAGIQRLPFTASTLVHSSWQRGAAALPGTVAESLPSESQETLKGGAHGWNVA